MRLNRRAAILAGLAAIAVPVLTPMLGSSRLRRVEVFRRGAWAVVSIMALRAGDHFRMFEPAGEPVAFVATEDPSWVEGDGARVLAHRLRGGDIEAAWAHHG